MPTISSAFSILPVFVQKVLAVFIEIVLNIIVGYFSPTDIN
jgi:hypothetical protein